MKKIRILEDSNLESDALTNSRADRQDGFDMIESDQTISEESVKIRPTKISLSGFTSWIRKISPTSEGMESEVERPLIIAKSGHRVTENEIKGQCDICEGYDSYIFNCHVYGCKKSLCLKHVYFFKYSEEKTPYCLEHYELAINEYDTWQQQ